MSVITLPKAVNKIFFPRDELRQRSEETSGENRSNP